MRITFLIPQLNFSGGNRVVAIYAERLRRRGHQVSVISGPYPKASLAQKISRKIRGHAWPTSIGPAQPYFDELKLPVRVLPTQRPISDADVPDADAVIATWWETAEWVAALSPQKGAKIYFIQHHEVFPYLPTERCHATYRLPLSKIVISQWLLETMSTLYDDRSCSLILNSVDTDQFFASPREKQASPTIGFLYSTVNFKGPDVLLSALKRIKDQLPETRAVAFGSEMISKQFPLPDWVEFHYRPAQHEIRSLYSKCDVWVCGSRSEGFHLPPIEAMACQCPVVSTRVGGPLDIIRDGTNGFLVDVNDSEGLARRTVDVLRLSGASWQSMSAAAAETAHRYSWDDATDLFEQALSRITSQSTC